MSYQLYTKSITELQDIAKVIVNNLSELVGCEDTSKLWHPCVGSDVCSTLRVNSLSCDTVPSKFEKYGVLGLSFTPFVNNSMSSICSKVLDYDKSVLDYTKLLDVKIDVNLDMKTKFKLYINSTNKSSSDMFDAMKENKTLMYSEYYKRLCWILLSTYAIRYDLYDFAYNKTNDFPSSVNYSIVDHIIENTLFEKLEIGNIDDSSVEFESSCDCVNEQLSLVLKNMRQLKYYVLDYVK